MSLGSHRFRWIDDVLKFWFVDLVPKDWWNGSPELDARIEERYWPLLDALTRSPPDAAMLDARGHAAAVIVFDQFSRQIFRGRAEAFATDGEARRLTIDAIDRGLDIELSPAERQFLYMPLMHAEDADLQRRSVERFGLIGEPHGLRSALAHRATFLRFGRFPYRNEALGRPSTPEERAFLASHPQPE